MSAEHRDLEAQIFESPEDPGPYVVYGDWLQAAGDPRGQLIATQLARLRDPTSTEIAAAEDVLIEEHPDLVPRLDVERQPVIEWHLGFWRSLIVPDYGWSERPWTPEHVELLLASKSAQFLRQLRVDAAIGADVFATIARFHRTLLRLDVSLRGEHEIHDADLWTLHTCSRLERLHLFNCSNMTVEGLAALAHFPRLRAIDLRNCTLTDEAAQCLAGLPLDDVFFNHVSGLSRLGMQTLAQLPLVSLKLTAVDTASLGDESIEPLAGHPTLTTLELSRAPISINGATAIGTISGLHRLQVHGARIGDDGVDALAPLVHLRSLTLGGVRTVTDNACATIGALTELRYLDISSTSIRAGGLRALRNLKELETLVLSFLDLDDDAVKELAGFHKLKALSLAFSRRITDTAIDVLLGLPSLTVLDLGGTEISERAIERLADGSNITTLGVYDCSRAVMELARAHDGWYAATRDLLELYDD